MVLQTLENSQLCCHIIQLLAGGTFENKVYDRYHGRWKTVLNLLKYVHLQQHLRVEGKSYHLETSRYLIQVSENSDT